MSHASFKRSERLQDELYRALSQMLINDIKEPRVQGVIITKVEVTEDLQNAKAYFRSLHHTGADKAAIADIEIGFKKIEGMIRHQLGKEFRLKKIPHFQFIFDHSLEDFNRIESLLKSVEFTS